MLALGRWSVPHFNGLPYLDKPVLFFWLMAAGFRIFGPAELAARLPAALGALATVGLTFAIGRCLFPDRRRPLLGAFIVASTPLAIAFGRLAIFDMPFTALVTAALFCLLRARLDGSPRIWLPLAGLAMGFATLTKGPVGLAVPLVGWWAGRGA
ncbi:MAG: phospholipid carrier-dependent glycosyltransferase, partial [Deltaproteobacteria bacterium]